jgi:hypothetical protein
MDCSKCAWSNPETCRICKAEQKERELTPMRQDVKEFTENSLRIGLHSATILLASYQHNQNN